MNPTQVINDIQRILGPNLQAHQEMWRGAYGDGSITLSDTERQGMLLVANTWLGMANVNISAAPESVAHQRSTVGQLLGFRQAVEDGPVKINALGFAFERIDRAIMTVRRAGTESMSVDIETLTNLKNSLGDKLDQIAKGSIEFNPAGTPALGAATFSPRVE